MHINIKEREKWKLIDMLEKDGVFYKYIYEKLYISNYGNVKKIINGNVLNKFNDYPREGSEILQ